MFSEVSVRGIRGVSTEEEKGRLWWEDLQKREILSLEWTSEGVMDDETGESMEPMETVWGEIFLCHLQNIETLFQPTVFSKNLFCC